MGDISRDEQERLDYEARSQAAYDARQAVVDGDPGPEPEPEPVEPQRPAGAVARVKDAAIQHGPVFALFHNRAPRLQQILPPWMSYPRFYMLGKRAIDKNPPLARADAESFWSAIWEAASLGLEPNTPLHQCSLIPYGREVQCQIEYRGHVYLASLSGVTAVAEAICENDEFTYRDGSEPFLHHRKPLRGGRGEPYAAFAVFTLPDGRRIWRVCDEDRIKRARDSSKAYQRAESNGKHDSPWHSDPAAMYAKTAIQDASRFVPHAPYMQRAAMVEQAKDAGEDVRHEPLDVRAQQSKEGDDA